METGKHNEQFYRENYVKNIKVLGQKSYSKL